MARCRLPKGVRFFYAGYGRNRMELMQRRANVAMDRRRAVAPVGLSSMAVQWPAPNAPKSLHGPPSGPTKSAQQANTIAWKTRSLDHA